MMTPATASSFLRVLRKQRMCAAAAAFGMAVLAGSAAASAADGPFAGLEGVWGGNGTVTYSSGTRERLHCRVQYIQANPDNLQQALRCASDSYKFQINAYFQHDAGNLTGHWAELTMNVSGTITGTVQNGHIQGSLHGPGFVATVLVDTRGNNQTVTISSADQEIRQVAIQVSRSSN